MDGRGVPTAVVIGRANEPDFLLLGPTLDAQQIVPGDDDKRVLCLDRGYRQRVASEIAEIFHFTPRVEAQNDEAQRLTIAGEGAKRWVVERTFSSFNRFRRLLIRWEKNPDNYLGFLHLACAIITLRHTPLPG